MNYADSEFKNIIILANCEINILSNDIKTAIDILKNVEPNDTCFEIAQMKLADIYLNHLKQPRAYTYCFTEIVSKSRNYKNLNMLAKAFFNI